MKPLQPELDRLKDDHRYRARRVLQSPQGVVVVVDGQPLLSFCSNDYLGLASHPELIRAMQQAVVDSGAGAGASHLLCGHHEQHHALEQELARFVGAPRALLFSTGYMANLAVLTSLVGRHGLVLEDRLNHASLIDAARLSGARVRRYRHGDTGQLAEWLAGTDGALVTTDAVFSMDGDLAPLPELHDHAVKNGAWLLADDAHGIGVLGNNGRGSLEYHGMGFDDNTIYMGTLGKALGSFGAFVAGTEEVIETLIQRARTYIYTTALPPPVAATTRAAIALLQRDPGPRNRLQENISYFRQCAGDIGLALLPSETAIQPVVLGDSARVLEVSQHLQFKGLLVPAIRPPTVPEGTARLRISLSAAHTREHLDSLLSALSDLSHPGSGGRP